MTTRSLKISLALTIVSSACTAQVVFESNIALNNTYPALNVYVLSGLTYPRR